MSDKMAAMDTETLVRVRLYGGRYDAILTCADKTAAGIEAVHEGQVIATATLSPDVNRKGSWRVALAVPAEVIGEGVQVIALRSSASGKVLDRIILMAGTPLDEDLRAEIAVLRDEVEMLKRAFRRHCVETGAS